MKRLAFTVLASLLASPFPVLAAASSSTPSAAEELVAVKLTLAATEAAVGRMAVANQKLTDQAATSIAELQRLSETNATLRAQVNALEKTASFTPEAAVLIAKRADSNEEWRRIVHGNPVEKIRSLELMATVWNYSDGHSYTQKFERATTKAEREQLQRLKLEAAKLEALARQIEVSRKTSSPRVTELLLRRWDSMTNNVLTIEHIVNP